MGPLPPQASATGVVLVHPITGALWVSLPQADGTQRRWNGSEWIVGLNALTPETATEDLIFEGERLLAAPTMRGGEIQHTYDDSGRLTGVVWPQGDTVVVGYDDAGRVRSIAGPGPHRWGLDWDDGLRATAPLGRVLEVDLEDRSNERIMRVKDAIGRVVMSRFSRDEDGEWRIIGWQDPRGLTTSIRYQDERINLRDPAGRDWRLRTDGDGRVVSVSLPDGHRWNWTRDDDGRVIRIDEPAGRTTRWERDDFGRVVSVNHGGHLTRYNRDEDGRVEQIVSPTGSVTVLKRDELGRVSQVQDAAGNTVYFQRHKNGWPSSVVGRTGGRWTIGIDTLGRPTTFEDPVGRTVRLRRDAAGRLVQIDHSVHGNVRLDRTGDGRLSRITDPLGRTLGLSRNGAGQVTQVIRTDGTSVALSRNPSGDVVAVTVNGERIDVERDPMGHAVRVGEVSWDRDIVGRVTALRRPGRTLMLSRDPSGLLRGLRAGSWSLTVQRDAAGWPIIWRDGASEVIVQRDAGGRVIVERSGARRIAVSRGALGLADRVSFDVGEWRWLRDAAARVLRIHGPEGVQVGFDRDSAGRITLVRYPSGAILRRRFEGAMVQETLTDRGGATISVRNVVRGADGQMESITDGEGTGWSWRRDPLGQIVSVERTDGRAWSWTMDEVRGPDGELILFDEDGRMMESRLGAGPSAWGVAAETMSVHRDALGRMDRISGNTGSLDLRYGSNGALTGASSSDRDKRWSLTRDARGRVASLKRAAETLSAVWHPDEAEGRVWGLLATLSESGTTKRVLGSDGGGAIWTGTEDASTVDELVVDVAQIPTWHLADGAAPTELIATPQGRLSDPAPGGFSPGGWWSPWPGGPLFARGFAVDPVSGERVDDYRGWPWSSRMVRNTEGSREMDPGSWAPESPWVNPLALLVAMGAIAPMDAEPWWAPPADPIAIEWLPASLDASEPVLGPHPHALPLDPMDPVTVAIIRALLPGGSPIDADLPVRAVLAEELTLPWLPPGLDVPGLSR